MRSRPTTGDLGCGACIRGWKGVSPQKNLQVATARGEPQRKKRPWQRKQNFSPILTTLEFLSCHLAYQELQNIVKTASNLRTHHLSFCAFFSQGLMRVKWDFILILALASNHLSVSLNLRSMFKLKTSLWVKSKVLWVNRRMNNNSSSSSSSNNNNNNRTCTVRFTQHYQPGRAEIYVSCQGSSSLWHPPRSARMPRLER